MQVQGPRRFLSIKRLSYIWGSCSLRVLDLSLSDNGSDENKPWEALGAYSTTHSKLFFVQYTHCVLESGRTHWKLSRLHPAEFVTFLWRMRHALHLSVPALPYTLFPRTTTGFPESCVSCTAVGLSRGNESATPMCPLPPDSGSLEDVQRTACLGPEYLGRL